MGIVFKKRERFRILYRVSISDNFNSLEVMEFIHNLYFSYGVKMFELNFLGKHVVVHNVNQIVLSEIINNTKVQIEEGPRNISMRISDYISDLNRKGLRLYGFFYGYRGFRLYEKTNRILSEAELDQKYQSFPDETMAEMESILDSK